MLQPEQAAEKKDAAEAGQHAAGDAGDHGGDVLFQKLELLVQRDGKADRCRGEEVAEVFGAFIINVVVEMNISGMIRK